MRSLSALPLRLRLALSFALVVLLLILVGGFAVIQLASLNRDTREIAESWLPRVRHVSTIKTAAVAIRVAQFQHLASEPAEEDGAVGVEDKAAAAEAEVNRQRAVLTGTIAAYAPLITADDERAQFDEFRKQWEAYEASSQIFMDVMKSGAKDVAMSMMTEQARIEFDAANAALDTLIDVSTAGVNAASERSASNYGTTLTLVIVAILVSVVVAATAALLLIRQIMRQLGGDPADVKRTVEQIADGELGGQIRLAAGDRDSLLAATKRMQGELLKLAGAQQQMHAQHAAGALAHRIDTGEFRGVYAELAAAVNTLAGTHIDVSRRAVEVIGRYARGDFSVDMDRLPGEQARITEAVDGVKQQLGAIKDETLKLADAAGRGEFSVRGDAARFEYAFRDIIDGLNRLMATSEQGLRSVGDVLGALAIGDLTRRMSGDFQGMFATLRDSANESVEQLSGIVRQIKKSAELIDAAAGEIASGNHDLSVRTENQAASLEETAAAVEQLAGTVNQNAGNAKEANGLAANAGDVAGRGGAVVDQVVTTMGAISVSSKKIADIIGVIDGIAFQTNILALNAAVEAARAGDQGRGFAVVASEVRALAQRSAEAAKEIKTLIGESVKNVTSGTELVSRAGQTMQEIVVAVKRVNDIMGEIAGASSEQSTGIGQVNQAIVQIDSTTQQNAALVEQAAAAARSLKEQAVELTDTIGTFRL